MRNNSSGCLTAFVSSFSRIMLLFAWIARPALMDAAFGSFIIPCLGLLPLHLQPAYAFLRHQPGSFPVAEAAAEQVLSLPLFPEMTSEQQDRVVKAIKEAVI